MTEKLSVVIPTLQKNKELLMNLINSLSKDSSVDEIILIDNSLQGIDEKIDKLRVITPKENMFVNPSWNLGVKEAKNDFVALLNDDITICKDFCFKIVSQMTSDMGIVGFSRDFVVEEKEILPAPSEENLTLETVDGRCGHFGIAMFFHKSAYVEIPEDIKIYWGDDWLFVQAKRLKRQNYVIANQKILHWGSLSCLDENLNPASKRDSKLFRKYTRKWWQFIFNCEKVYKGVRFTIFGIEILKHFDKKH